MSEQKSPIEEVREDVKKILAILNGNGAVGLCAKVNIMWASMVFIISAIVLLFLKLFFMNNVTRV